MIAPAPEGTADGAVPGGREHPFRTFLRHLAASRGAVVGAGIVVAILAVALGADWLAPHPAAEQYRDHFLRPPAWQEGGTWTFPLGTDAVGRDQLSRLMHGARFSLFMGCIVVSISMTAGIALGVVAGYLRGVVDAVLMRVMDVILSFPSLLLALVLVAILGPSLSNAMVAIAVVLLPHFVRLTRASVIGEATRDYVVASRVAGAGPMRQMFVNILPNCLGPLIVQATLSFSTAILDAAALGFLGMGAQPPTPEWGTMLAESREFITRAWWIVTFPGLAILVSVLAFNLLGDGIRDALDPRLRR